VKGRNAERERERERERVEVAKEMMSGMRRTRRIG